MIFEFDARDDQSCGLNNVCVGLVREIDMLKEGNYFGWGKIIDDLQVMRAFLDQLKDFLEQDLADLKRSVQLVAYIDQLA